ncbi:MAG: peptidylprolyl isomerase [Chloroflexota bacterium]
MAKKSKAPLPYQPTRRRLARWQEERRRRRITLIVGAAVIVTILAIIGYGVYDTVIAPGRERVATVGQQHLTVGDYETALRLLSAQQPSAKDVLEGLVNFELIRQGADELGIEATQDEIMEELRNALTGEGEELTDEELLQRYSQTLDYLGVSDEEFREGLATQVLGKKIEEYLRGEVPEVGEVIPHVHLKVIPLTTAEQAQNVTARLEEGEDFASLAAQFGGGDTGWVPEGAMSLEIEEFAFNAQSGNVTQYFASSEGYSVVRVVEPAQDRPLADEDTREQLQDAAYGHWLEVQRDQKVTWQIDEQRLQAIYQSLKQAQGEG